MHILVHDYAGHPFQAQLSRELARRGHSVCHTYFGADKGPKGRLERGEGDPPSLTFSPLLSNQKYSKTNLLARRAADLAYGRAAAALIAQLRPDIVISGNTPTEAQAFLMRAAYDVGAAFVYWCQDFYSIAATRLLSRKLLGLGSAVGAYYRWLERRQMRAADHIVHISDSFLGQTDRWGIPRSRVAVIPNWGALDEIPMRTKPTAWGRAHGLTGRPVVLYSGTLALKHNPGLLQGLAENVAQAETVVVASGVGADALAAAKERYDLSRLHLLPLQPFEMFPDVLASADVLVAVIEREAGAFSVPSKILSYLCAGRPVVLAAPRDNLAVLIVEQSGAGTVVEPEDTAGFVAGVRRFLEDQGTAAQAGAAGRAYAEANFDIGRVTDRFEAVFGSAISGRAGRGPQRSSRTPPGARSVPRHQ